MLMSARALEPQQNRLITRWRTCCVCVCDAIISIQEGPPHTGKKDTKYAYIDLCVGSSVLIDVRTRAPHAMHSKLHECAQVDDGHKIALKLSVMNLYIPKDKANTACAACGNFCVMAPKIDTFACALHKARCIRAPSVSNWRSEVRRERSCEADDRIRTSGVMLALNETFLPKFQCSVCGAITDLVFLYPRDRIV